MGTRCAVPLCKGQGGFHFPKDPSLKKKWCVAIRREGPNKWLWQPKPRSVVCYAHFEPSDMKSNEFNLRKFLKKDVVPSIFEWKVTKEKDKRQERIDRRAAAAASFSTFHSSPMKISMPGETKRMAKSIVMSANRRVQVTCLYFSVYCTKNVQKMSRPIWSLTPEAVVTVARLFSEK